MSLWEIKNRLEIKVCGKKIRREYWRLYIPVKFMIKILLRAKPSPMYLLLTSLSAASGIEQIVCVLFYIEKIHFKNTVARRLQPTTSEEESTDGPKCMRVLRG